LAKATRLIPPESSSLSHTHTHVNKAPLFRLALCDGVGGGRPINECSAPCLTQARFDKLETYVCVNTHAHKNSLSGGDNDIFLASTSALDYYCLPCWIPGGPTTFHLLANDTNGDTTLAGWLHPIRVGSARAEQQNIKQRLQSDIIKSMLQLLLQRSSLPGNAPPLPPFAPFLSIVASLLARSLPTRKPRSPAPRYSRRNKRFNRNPWVFALQEDQDPVAAGLLWVTHPTFHNPVSSPFPHSRCSSNEKKRVYRLVPHPIELRRED
jgi:hypothetical protein